ncbi:hypothetical protein ACFQ3P_13715 [Paraburkholderia sabiae]|uniref:AlpA family phage regulatory protein n=1 Tax=Paraburkholderia sabiae TaxID=273251 RepID=A0ABU9QD34_9BURK|nr:hypothetical protein [Paraburkholderia sabiae]WJZ76156.1 hypothetical protein QEN71_10255 [Paraburkholderia sabiae]CAD6526126.1 hypothetical protein LMG24235_01921 [Paraburkholderia sabiae]
MTIEQNGQTLGKKLPQGRPARPKPVTIDLNQPGRLRVGHLLTLLSVSHDSFYRKLKAGAIPAPSGRDPRPYWNTATIRDYLAGGHHE